MRPINHAQASDTRTNIHSGFLRANE